MHAPVPLVAVVVRPEAGPVLESFRPLPRGRVQVADDPVPAPEETRRRCAGVVLSGLHPGGYESVVPPLIRATFQSAGGGTGRSQANGPARR
jgi:hypothetical protein